VSTRLKCLLEASDLDNELEFGKELLIVHRPSVPVGDVCMRLFGSQPSSETPYKGYDLYLKIKLLRVPNN
jgi:hypothetical protein